MKEHTSDHAIGYYLRIREGTNVICLDCAPNSHYRQFLGGKVYPVDIAPFSQTCVDCGKVLVKGRTGMIKFDD